MKLLRLFLGILLLGLGIYLAFYHADYSFEATGRVPNANELYDPSLARIKGLKAAQNYIDSSYSSQYQTFDSIRYLQVTENFVKRKFYHGNATSSWKENWICWILGKTIWSHFNSLVAPEEVIKHSQAMCSQQTMVFTYLMKQKGFQYRYAYLLSKNRGHFCCEIWQGGVWHFVDVDMEPNWERIKSPANISLEKSIKNNDLKRIYDSSYACIKETVNKSSKAKYEDINKEVGSKMIIFHLITKGLSFLLPIVIGFSIIKRQII